MSSDPITLKGFFDVSGVKQDQLAAIEDSRKTASLGAALSDKAPGVTWPAALGEIVGKIDDLVDIPVSKVVAGAWNKYRLLQKYADTKKYPPSETIMVPLATHTIRSIHKPYVEILVEDKPIGTIAFEIDLELTLEGVLLSIQNGKIMEVRIGRCQGKGRVRCEEVVVAERETKEFPLPGSIRLKEGIPIPP